MHGEVWNGKQDLTGWWMSEKLDGVRAYWNGEMLISKQGNKIECPKWFVEDLPKDVSLDGELWMGKNSFETVVAAMNSQNADNWKSVKYMVFDLPKSEKPFEDRMDDLKKLKLNSHAVAVKRDECTGNTHLVDSLRKLVEKGGEGWMLNMPGSKYVGERTGSLLKVKVEYLFR